MQSAEDTTIYADSLLLVLDKEAGLLCVPGRGAGKADCLSARVQQRFPDALVVHRLDMATSGLVVMARGAAMQRALSMMFANRQVAKGYVAVVAGLPAVAGEDWQCIDLPIAADWPNRPRRIVDHAHGKPSVTRWRVLARDAVSGTARIELEPHTGRTHQLRVHLAAIGHAIVGDPLYASTAIAALSPRLLLHATRLEFAHPLTGARLQLHSPVPF